jgi:ADP-ribosylation factor-like protein 2
LGSGLDNAGKTTIVKRLMNEDVNAVSPTLGFIIKTIDYQGQVNGFASERVDGRRDRLTSGEAATSSTSV